MRIRFESNRTCTNVPVLQAASYSVAYAVHAESKHLTLHMHQTRWKYHKANNSVERCCTSNKQTNRPSSHSRNQVATTKTIYKKRNDQFSNVHKTGIRHGVT